MNLLKEVLAHEVFPALGCTEPIAVAYAASRAAKEVDGAIKDIEIVVDPGVYKNGLAVTVPNTGGARGNLIAGVLGALVRRPDLKMEVLRGVNKSMVACAKKLIRRGAACISYNPKLSHFYIDAVVRTKNSTAHARIEHWHTNVVLLEKDHRTLLKEKKLSHIVDKTYKRVLARSRISSLVDCAAQMDNADSTFIKDGIAMNLRIAEKGRALKKVGFYLAQLVRKGYLLDDLCSTSKIMTASATDARMAGVNLPVMASGGSGNQGIVAILVPYSAGKYLGIAERKILESIALSHLMNSYIKCFTGDLSPLCGCSIAAGVGAAVAIVYQLKGKDMPKITLAINNVISDLGGMLCDGAKGGCALKVVSSTDAAIRSAYMAAYGYGITQIEGFVGKTAEDTIRNLSAISSIGMANVDATMLGIMKRKATCTCQTRLRQK